MTSMNIQTATAPSTLSAALPQPNFAHLSAELTFASPDWSLERAAEAMVRGGFRHLVVVDGGDMVGVLSIRDIVRCWVSEGATSEMPRETAAG